MISQKEIHNLAIEKGWWDKDKYPDPSMRLPESLMLMVSELAEVLEDYRNGRAPQEIYYEIHADMDGKDSLKPCGIPIEFADLIIRVRDTCESLGIDLEKAIREKHEFNKTRPFKHGGKKV